MKGLNFFFVKHYLLHVHLLSVHLMLHDITAYQAFLPPPPLPISIIAYWKQSNIGGSQSLEMRLPMMMATRVHFFEKLAHF